MRHDDSMNDRVGETTGRGWGLAIAIGIVALVAGALAFATRVADLPVPSFVDRYGALGMGAALGFGLTGAAIVSARPAISPNARARSSAHAAPSRRRASTSAWSEAKTL